MRKCACCGAQKAVVQPATRELRERMTCAACGYDSFRRSAVVTADLPRPHDMGDEEFRFRAHLFFTWRLFPASAFLEELRVFADWLADRDRPEEAAARADWKVYGANKTDPAKWWRWSVPVARGWVSVETRRERIPPMYNGERTAYRFARYLKFDAAQTQPRQVHNGAWFLCWPPGFVRFTAPLHFDATRYHVTLGWNRTGKRYEAIHPHGYTTLFYPPGELPPPAQAAVEEAKGPSLLDGYEVPT